MIKKENIYDKIRTSFTKRAAFWKLFGKTVPLFVLSVLFLLHLFGFDDLSEKALVVGGAFFFFVACMWWWWVIDVMMTIVNLMTRATETFNSVTEDITKVKEDVIKAKKDLEDRNKH